MPILTWAAFIILIVIGSFFMLNLVLGVLSGYFKILNIVISFYITNSLTVM